MDAQRGRIVRWVTGRWYAPRANPLLIPAAWLFGAVVGLRRLLYRTGWRATCRAAVPVVVVGNVTVGGSGKTPLVAWLCDACRDLGLEAGIVSRGYGGGATASPQRVTPDSDPAAVGDEAVMLAEAARVPVVVCRDRCAAVRELEAEVDVVIADDGLQHLAMGRDLEIAVVDLERGLGNGRLLPAGPLREPSTRLERVDVVLHHGAGGDMILEPGALCRLADPAERLTAPALADRREVHAVAGIGHPQRFFRLLREQLGVPVVEHAFADHHAFDPQDLAGLEDACVVMTAKDAVKCRVFAGRDWWYLPVRARLTGGAEARLRQRLQTLAGVLPRSSPA